MRSLTADEKALSLAAKKRANAELAKWRKGMLWSQQEKVRDVKGLPVTLRGRNDVILDFELLSRLIRTLKRRPITLRIEPGRLTIDFGGQTEGQIRLFDLPAYQRERLSDLPVIEMEELL
ncbi:hypothetical protein [Gorillibacterium sp. sgz500922]|uniref:hypothetical protein n=1 Tax=Gorillibacterium sp. sgz500922 TaxID=3446694 RepID=UPI003F670BC2